MKTRTLFLKKYKPSWGAIDSTVFLYGTIKQAKNYQDLCCWCPGQFKRITGLDLPLGEIVKVRATFEILEDQDD